MKMSCKSNQEVELAEEPLFVGVAGFPGGNLVGPQTPASKPVVVTLSAGATSAEIQQAMDCLPDSGGEVVLPPGIFEVGQPIVLRRDHQTLRGSGTANRPAPGGWRQLSGDHHG